MRVGKAESSSKDVDGPRGRFSARGLVQFVIGVGALLVVLIRSDATALVEAIRHTRMAFFPLAVAASFAVTWLMSYRWRMILAARGLRFRTATLFVYYLIGIFFTSFVPGGGVSGDVARLIYVDRKVRNKSLVLSTLVYERLIGVFTLLLIGLAATIATRVSAQGNRMIYISEAVLLACFLAFTVLVSDSVSSRVSRIVRRAGARLRTARIAEAAARTLEDFSRLKRDPALLVRCLLLSMLIRVVWGLGCYAIAYAMDLPVGLLTVFSFISLVDLIRLMPISVGGLGVREWVVIVIFAGVGIAQEKALTFSFLAFAPIYMNAVAGGIIYITTARLRAPGQVQEIEIPG